MKVELKDEKQEVGKFWDRGRVAGESRPYIPRSD